MIFVFYLSLLGFVNIVRAQEEPISWMDVNPPAEHDHIVLVEGSVTSYIGPTDFLSTVVVTSSVSGTFATVTASLEYSAVTATAAAEDDSVGDVSIAISANLKSSWLDLAAKHCGAPAQRLARRDFASCALDYVSEAGVPSGSTELIGPPRLPMVTAGDIANVIAEGMAIGRIAASNKGYAALALIALAAWFEKGQQDMPTNLKIPAAQVETETTPTESSTCPPPKETGKPYEVICQDRENCDGDPNSICQTGKYKDCPCEEAIEPIPHEGTHDLDIQQAILAAWAAGAEDGASLPSTTSTHPNPKSSPNADRAKCLSDSVGIDPTAAQKLADLFCDTIDLTRDNSKNLGGSDLSPAISIDQNRKVLFFFRKHAPDSCDGSPEGCKEALSSIIKTCQFNSHYIYGRGVKEGECGTYDLRVTEDFTPNECTGTKDSNKECDVVCAPRTGVCVQSSKGPINCRCS